MPHRLLGCPSLHHFLSRISRGRVDTTPFKTMKSKAACALLLSRPPRTKKSVRFANSCKVVMIETTASEGISTWYAEQEYQSIIVLCKQNLVAFARAKWAGAMSHFDANRHCLRGLERLFPADRRRYAEMKESMLSLSISTNSGRAISRT
jgi:hypothetical protein